ncbi:Pentatricopeptide repeat-containing protein At2g26790, mitochondrial [Linum grandiflorum]
MTRILCFSSSDRKLDFLLGDVVESRGELGFELFDLLQVLADDGGCHVVSKVLDVLVKRLAQLEMFDEALDVLARVKDLRVMPSIWTVNFLMKRLIDSNKAGTALAIYLQLVTRFGLKPNACTYGFVVKALCETGMLEEAKEVLVEMEKLGFVPHVYAYRLVIHGLCRIGKFHEALSIHEDMLSKGWKTNCEVVSLLLQGLLSDAGTVSEVPYLFKTCKSTGMYLHKVCYNKVMKAYCKSGNMEAATALLTEMKDKHIIPDLVNYTTLIDGYCGEGKIGEACSFFKEMKANGIKPDLIVYNVLASGFSRYGDATDTRKLLDFMNDDGIEPTSDTYGIIIEGLCKAEKLEDAEAFFAEWIKKDGSLDICNAMVNGYCSAKSVEKAFELFVALSGQGYILKKKTCLKLLSSLEHDNAKYLQMAAYVLHLVDRGEISVDVVTYTEMIQGYCKANRLGQARKVLDGMKKLGVKPDIVTYTVLLDGLLKKYPEGRNHELFMKEMNEMNVEPDAFYYTVLIGSSSNAENMERAKELFKEMIDRGLEPDTPAYTALLCGLLSVGDIDGTKELLNEMSDKQLVADDVFELAIKNGWEKAKKLQRCR